ncbi:MAG: lipopolysaccharide kinase InaA family protein [Pseudomonadota bacterium]
MMINDVEKLRERISAVAGRSIPGRLQIVEDTSDFMSIDYGNVLRLNGNDYLVMGNAREGRFGIDEQPKFWVKSCIDLSTGLRKIIKLVFKESFESRIGSSVYQCVRSAKKESDVLKAMQDNPHFMHGKSVLDAAGNLVRVIDFVRGQTFYEYMRRFDMSHETYYQQIFPNVIQRVIDCIQAIADLHDAGLHHGDIRADHILLDNPEEPFVWIDFDYDIDSLEYDVICLGNVLLQAVGKGRHTLYDIRLNAEMYPDYNDPVISDDMSLMFPHRVANLRKVFPHIAGDLNDILMRFSSEGRDRYRHARILVSDLRSLFPRGSA